MNNQTKPDNEKVLPNNSTIKNGAGDGTKSAKQSSKQNVPSSGMRTPESSQKKGNETSEGNHAFNTRRESPVEAMEYWRKEADIGGGYSLLFVN